MSSNAIAVRGVNKTFRVPLDRSSTLKYRITHFKSSSRYRTLRALEDITFDVPEGQFLGITGHNGCGKSTLLKILSRIYTADSGSVAINGRVSPFLELGVGFSPELTARENIFLGGALLGMTRSELRSMADEILEFADLTDFADQKLKNFSSGMQVRLAFSVAIRANAQILLMDEVLAVGDARFQEKCFDMFARYKREGRTIVLVTHNLDAIRSYCDRAVLLDHGHLAGDGIPADVVADYLRLVAQRSESDDARLSTKADHFADRWGTGEVRIAAARLLDGSGKPHTSFVTDEPFVVELEYEVHQAVDAFMFGFAIQRSDGLAIASPNSRADGCMIPAARAGDRGTVRYRIERLPVLGGSYRLAAAVADPHRGEQYDHVEDLLTFRVVDERVRKGLVDPGGAWTSERAG